MTTQKINYKKLEYNDQQKDIIYKEIVRFGDDRGDFINIPLEVGEKNNIIFKRSYIITNNNVGVVRAFHGHKKEGKLFYVPQGAFKFIIIGMKSHEWKEYNLLASAPKILYIPPNYYNGFSSLTDDALLIVYSTSSMQKSMQDDYRLQYDILGKNIWKIHNR